MDHIRYMSTKQNEAQGNYHNTHATNAYSYW